MRLNEEIIFIDYEELPIPIICFNKYIKITYLNSEAKEMLKKISGFEFNLNKNKFTIPIWLNIKVQEFMKSDYNHQIQIKRIETIVVIV